VLVVKPLLTATDHPRPCGEQSASMSRTTRATGSPPPLRGTASITNEYRNKQRITPAPAGNRLSNCPEISLLKDHPRPCGEQAESQLVKITEEGSPPPLRGTVHVEDDFSVGSRITPAPAGNRVETLEEAISGGDHPRPCGEQLVQGSGLCVEPGSPPPLRGTDPIRYRIGYFMGITPAPAGNRDWGRLRPGPREDHPRPCGEQNADVPMTRADIGSPPPLRGTGPGILRQSIPLGITPAPAGNSGVLASALNCQKDHPRPCGEQMSSGIFEFAGKGSPPPLRGTVWFVMVPAAKYRITPAPAGNRPARHGFAVLCQDHPRPCGEQCNNGRLFLPRSGSPPPLRGTDSASSTNGQNHRITPAPAGNSRLLPGSSAPLQDHPRPCGEQPVQQNIAGVALGSPPPLRGTDPGLNKVVIDNRITPAPAGNSSLSL